jgi:L-alanine-DL-glutamate epimerase-like enolase superfamily enzyme
MLSRKESCFKKIYFNPLLVLFSIFMIMYDVVGGINPIVVISSIADAVSVFCIAVMSVYGIVTAV